MNMKRNWMKATALCMTAAVFCCGLSGCKKTEKAAGSGEITYAADGKIYPMQCEDTLSLWIDMGASDNGQSGMEATPFGKAWMEQTGVNVEFMHPTAGSTEPAEPDDCLRRSSRYHDCQHRTGAGRCYQVRKGRRNY